MYMESQLTVQSDKDNHLVAAGKEGMNVDWDTITKRCSAKVITWSFTPVGAPSQNGAVETFVKSLKSPSRFYTKHL